MELQNNDMDNIVSNSSIIILMQMPTLFLEVLDSEMRMGMEISSEMMTMKTSERVQVPLLEDLVWKSSISSKNDQAQNERIWGGFLKRIPTNRLEPAVTLTEQEVVVSEMFRSQNSLERILDRIIPEDHMTVLSILGNVTLIIIVVSLPGQMQNGWIYFQNGWMSKVLISSPIPRKIFAMPGRILMIRSCWTRMSESKWPSVLLGSVGKKSKVPLPIWLSQQPWIYRDSFYHFSLLPWKRIMLDPHWS